GGKHGASESPVDVTGTEPGGAGLNRAAKRLRTSGWGDRGRGAAACRDGGNARAARDVGNPGVPCERSQAKHRVEDAGSAPHHSGALPCDIPSKTDPWGEVLVVGLDDSVADARLTLLHQSQRGIE